MNIKEIRHGSRTGNFHSKDGLIKALPYHYDSFHTCFRQVHKLKNAPLWLIVGAFYEISTEHILN